MRFASLGSGSRGNGMVVEAGGTRLLLDCGFTLKETEARLQRLALSPADLAGILVTHEHSDHAQGVFRLARRHRLPVWLTHGTLGALSGVTDGVELRPFDPHIPFSVGDILVEPFPVPHDAREPAQFVFGDGARRIGVLTDAGCVTAHMVAVLGRCDALVLECNHDPDMLHQGPYPPPLKKRIAGRFGHLSNGEAGALLARLDRTGLQHVVAAHLSEQNNLPELAVAALAGVLGCASSWVAVAEPDEGLDWREVT